MVSKRVFVSKKLNLKLWSGGCSVQFPVFWPVFCGMNGYMVEQDQWELSGGVAVFRA